MRVKRSKDCGNSPKNKFVQDVCIALMKADVRKLSVCISDDVEWIVGDRKPIVGPSLFLDTIHTKKREKIATLQIEHVVSHGKVGAVNGKAMSVAGRESNFCVVFEFTSAAAKTIQRIYSYGAIV